jgi:hypothetical protein
MTRRQPNGACGTGGGRDAIHRVALIATERLSLLPDGRLLYRLKRRWRDGTSHVIFEPLELVEKLGCGGSSATIVLDGHAK